MFINIVTYRNICKYVDTHTYVCVQRLVYTRIFLFFIFLLSAERNDTSLATSTPSTQTLVSNTIVTSRRPGSLEKWLTKIREKYVQDEPISFYSTGK